MTDKSFKSGFIAVVGRTNVGKSTLLNALIGQKVSIVSDKPQTTRNNIRLIRTTASSQMVFIDTPGFHKPKTKLGTFMVDAAGASVRDVDLVLFLVEEEPFIGKGDRMILDKLAGCGVPVILVINKMDKIPKEELLKKIELFSEFGFIDEVIPISALKAENIETLVTAIESYLSEGPMFFPEDMVTDRAERFLVQEMIREKVLRFLQQEVPHGVAVEVMSMKERPNGTIVDIDVNIYCERKSHKGILIGKNGEMLKKIGSSARRDIEEMLDAKVNLTLWVKVRDDWRDRPFDLNELGYTKDDE
ncbi:MAG: GTPase Era [Anaerofustis sp.]